MRSTWIFQSLYCMRCCSVSHIECPMLNSCLSMVSLIYLYTSKCKYILYVTYFAGYMLILLAVSTFIWPCYLHTCNDNLCIIDI